MYGVEPGSRQSDTDLRREARKELDCVLAGPMWKIEQGSLKRGFNLITARSKSTFV